VVNGPKEARAKGKGRRASPAAPLSCTGLSSGSKPRRR